MPRVVVLGTGTGVGKTHVTAALARALARLDARATVLAVKPIETGVQRRRPTQRPPPGSDAALLEGASRGTCPRPHPLYALRRPVSAHLAAREEGTRITALGIRAWIDAATLPHATLPDTTWLLVETAGGAYSPVTSRLTNADLATRLGPAIWVLVAPDSLGVLHDLRATLLALKVTARAPDHLVLTSARAPDASTDTNAAELVRVGLPRPAAVIGRDGDPVDALLPLARRLLRGSTR